MEGRRALPSWMQRKERTASEKEPLRSCRRNRKTAKAAVYCMNEKELVEAAVSYLTNSASQHAALLPDQKVEDEAVDTTVKMREDPAASKTTAKRLTEALEEEPSDCSDAQETTYVSETDLDITEVGTVPYTKSPQQQGPEAQGSGPARDRGSLGNVELEAEMKEEHSQTPADAAKEDDAFQLVREIFFT
ncbi:cell cycle regulator of non-homologous end joining [Pempheris klunzingeri]|uniref:cell cycle regulator of non-homologous end joining n=1 Tax=Pempheris klunzingeri TaxID=3127111 RepID=UPI00398063A9